MRNDLNRTVRPLQPLVGRAVTAYLLLRILLIVVAALAGELAGAEAARDFESPIGRIALAAVVGVVDTRRRGETLFWANLGYSRWVIPFIFGVIAVAAESVLAVVLP